MIEKARSDPALASSIDLTECPGETRAFSFVYLFQTRMKVARTNCKWPCIGHLSSHCFFELHTQRRGEGILGNSKSSEKHSASPEDFSLFIFVGGKH